jgi:hypothetical protein
MHGDSVWEHLETKGALILEKWCRLVLGTYPADAAGFFQREGDRFVNPVGYVISQEIKTIYDELLHGMNLEKLTHSLDEIIRIRAVQDFLPSRATGFIFLLKQAAREELAGEITGKPVSGELLDFESRIDGLALLAFDVYMKCREKICEIRVSEMAAQRDMALGIMARTSTADELGESA